MDSLPRPLHGLAPIELHQDFLDCWSSCSAVLDLLEPSGGVERWGKFKRVT